MELHRNVLFGLFQPFAINIVNMLSGLILSKIRSYADEEKSEYK